MKQLLSFSIIFLTALSAFIPEVYSCACCGSGGYSFREDWDPSFLSGVLISGRMGENVVPGTANGFKGDVDGVFTGGELNLTVRKEDGFSKIIRITLPKNGSFLRSSFSAEFGENVLDIMYIKDPVDIEPYGGTPAYFEIRLRCSISEPSKSLFGIETEIKKDAFLTLYGKGNACLDQRNFFYWDLSFTIDSKKGEAPVIAVGKVFSGYSPEDEIRNMIEKLSMEKGFEYFFTAARLKGMGKPAAPFLMTALKSGNPYVRLGAAYALGRVGTGSEDAVPEIAKLTKDRKWVVRYHAVRSLGKLAQDKETSIPALLAALKDSSGSVRTEAINALEHFGERAKEAVPDVLHACLEPDNAEEYQYALGDSIADTLLKIGKAGVPYLIKGLKEQEARVRLTAVQVLGDLGPAAQEATSTLKDVLNDPEPLVRMSACLSLAKIDPSKFKDIQNHPFTGEIRDLIFHKGYHGQISWGSPAADDQVLKSAGPLAKEEILQSKQAKRYSNLYLSSSLMKWKSSAIVPSFEFVGEGGDSDCSHLVDTKDGKKFLTMCGDDRGTWSDDGHLFFLLPGSIYPPNPTSRPEKIFNILLKESFSITNSLMPQISKNHGAVIVRNKIYWTDGSNLYRAKWNSKDEPQKVLEGQSIKIVHAGDGWVYFTNAQKLLRVSDGGRQEELIGDVDWDLKKSLTSTYSPARIKIQWMYLMSQDLNLGGMKHYRQKNYAEASKQFKESSQYFSTNPIPLYNLACVQALTRQTDQAIQALKTYSSLNPNWRKKVNADKDFDPIRASAIFKAFLNE